MKIKNEQNVYQFKNAIHMGYMVSQDPNYNTDSCMNTQRSGLKFSPEISRSTLHQLQHTVSNRKTIQHTGITIDDEGNVLIAQWKNNKIDGRYFLFKPLGFSQQSKSKQTGICQFGHMKNGMLYNENFLYEVNGSLAKCNFERDKIYDNCFIYHKSNLKSSKQQVQCKLLTFQPKLKTNLTPKQNKKILIPPIKNIARNISKKQNLPLIEVNTSQLLTLSQFFQLFIKQANHNELIQNITFQKITVSQSEFVVGFFRSYISQDKKNKQNSLKLISGFGILFRNDWPCKYGFFQNDKLNGYGRLCQSQLQVLDGLFENDLLIEGFVFDHFKNKTYFGQKLDHKQFRIYQQLTSIQTAYMLQYKKSQHLKSLDFINNYFNLPNIIYKSPWPYQVVKVLQQYNSLKYIINVFKNELDISQIEKKGQLTEDKVQQLLVKELKQSEQTSRVLTSRSKINSVKNMAIKNGISSYLKQVQPSIIQKYSSRQCQLKRSIQQYQELISARKSSSVLKQSSRKKSKQSSKKYSQLSKDYKHQINLRQINIQDNSNYSRQKSKDFGELISTYREYEVQKNAILSQEAFLQNLNQTKKHKIERKSTMIKLDHQKHLNDLNRTPRKACHHRKNKTALQLDQIYRMHFKNLKK